MRDAIRGTMRVTTRVTMKVAVRVLRGFSVHGLGIRPTFGLIGEGWVILD